MTSSGISIRCCSPAACSDRELAAFVRLVVSGGEVDPQGLNARVHHAVKLSFAVREDLLVGVAALKTPSEAYREKISRGSGVEIPVASVPYELGWVYVIKEARGQGLAFALSEAALTASQGHSVLATTRSENGAMQRCLAQLGFSATGGPFFSRLADYQLQLFFRPITGFA